MSAQDHIDAIGAAQVRLEETIAEMLEEARKAEAHAKDAALLAKRANRETRELHALQDAAQRAYSEAHPEDNVVLFSGGSNKPKPQ